MAGSGCAAAVQHQKATSVVQSGRTGAQRKETVAVMVKIPGVIVRLTPAGSRQDREITVFYRPNARGCCVAGRARNARFGNFVAKKSWELPKVSE
ncbi:hypothetical protein BURCENBC7_AP5028 [Burkholderia cenocepacia BC7]|nr:hypothetical protein BURCENBC7_AP5028 [Burkholderia cenocepacia BC7]